MRSRTVYSGRTLAEILSLSYPEELSSSKVERVAPGLGKEGTLVEYHRYEDEDNLKDLRRRMGLLEGKVAALESELSKSNKKIETCSTVLVEWQTANLVLHAFATYAWNLLSNVNKTELKQHGLHGFLDLFYARLRPGTSRPVAWRIYLSMDENIRMCAEIIMYLKGDLNRSGHAIAHPPPVSDTQIAEFLQAIGEDIAKSNVDLFEHLKSTSNTPENIKNAVRGG